MPIVCAVCFTGFQAIPMAAVAGRAWWVKRGVLAGAGSADIEPGEGLDQPVPGHPLPEHLRPEHLVPDKRQVDAERFALA